MKKSLVLGVIFFFLTISWSSHTKPNNKKGLIEALKREFMEECNAEIEIIKHFYTTDFFYSCF